MQIPEHGFGYKGPASAQRTRIDIQDDTGAAIERFGNNGMRIAGNMLDEQARAEKAAAELKAARAIGERELAIDTVHADISAKVAEGALPYDKVSESYQSAIAKLEPVNVDGIDKATRERMDYSIDMLGKRGSLKLQPVIAGAKQGAFRSDMEAILDAQSKKAGFADANIDAINKGVDAMDDHGRIAYGDKWGTVKQGFRDKNWNNHATALIGAAGDDLDALNRVKADISGDKWADKLEANNRLQLIAHLDNGISRIENKNEMMAMRAESRAQNAMGDIDRQISSGIPATPAMWSTWGETVKGTAHEADFNARMDAERETQNLLRKPVTDQVAYLQEAESNLMQNGGDMTQAANVARMSNAVQQNLKLMKEQPLLFNQQRTGMDVEPIDFAQLMTPGAEGAVTANMRDRVNTIRALQDKNSGMVGMVPLLPQEAEQLTAQMKGMAPNAQAQFLGSLNRSFGDNDAYLAAMGQIAKEAPMTALAGTLAAKRSMIETKTGGWFSDAASLPSRDIAATLLTGERVLKENKGAVAMPKDSDFDAALTDYAGEAFDGHPQARATTLAGVRAYYAGAVSSGADPETAQQEALRAVLGGVAEHNGRKVVVPYGMNASEFSGRAQDAFRSAAKAGGLPESIADDFESYDLQSAGDGRYFVKVGNEYLGDADGKPLRIDMNGGKP